MSRLLTITINPTTRTTTTRTCVWEQRSTYQWRATITNECANRLRAALTRRTPDAWHLENDESDEWEISTEQYEQLQEAHGKCKTPRFTIPRLPQDFTTGYVTVSIN